MSGYCDSVMCSRMSVTVILSYVLECLITVILSYVLECLVTVILSYVLECLVTVILSCVLECLVTVICAKEIFDVCSFCFHNVLGL